MHMLPSTSTGKGVLQSGVSSSFSLVQMGSRLFPVGDVADTKPALFACTAISLPVCMTKENTGLFPSSLVTLSSPPRSSVSCLVTVSPRPVSLYLRVVLPSAWVKMLNTTHSLFFGIPIPVSSTCASPVPLPAKLESKAPSGWKTCTFFQSRRYIDVCILISIAWVRPGVCIVL